MTLKATIEKQLFRGVNLAAVALYRRSKGRIGGSVKGIPVLLLTVPGRSTGTPHSVPVAYFEHNGDYLLAGSAGGSKRDPHGSATSGPPPLRG